MSPGRSLTIHQLTDRLMRFSHTVRASCCVPFQAVKLHRRQLQILLFLAKVRQPISSSALAIAMQVTTGAITQLIDELVAQGLVVRQLAETDRRVIKLSLSVTGKQHLQAFRTAQRLAVEPLFADLTQTELDKMLLLINKITPSQQICDGEEK